MKTVYKRGKKGKLVSTESCPLSTSKSKYEKCNIDIRDQTPVVSDQKSEGCCLSMAIKDVVETTIKMYGGAPKDLMLTPQALIDSRIYKNWYEVDDLVGDDDYGLESITTQPFLRMERPIKEWDMGRYKSRPYPTYHISGMQEYRREDHREDKDPSDQSIDMKFWEEGIIVEQIKENFRVGGKNFPLVGTLKMGSLKSNEVAARFAKDLNKPPFRHHIKSQSKSKRQKIVETDKFYHSVVIVGLNTMSKNSRNHYCWIKNTYGRKWGLNGFSRVGLDVFVSVGVPSYDPEEWAKLREEKKKEDNMKKPVDDCSQGESSSHSDTEKELLEKKEKEDEMKKPVDDCSQGESSSHSDTEIEAVKPFAKFLDGRRVLNEIKKEVATEVLGLKVVPRLTVILVGDRKDSVTHVRNKVIACGSVGIDASEFVLAENCTEEDILEKILDLNSSKLVHGILVQLPLPSHINEQNILKAVIPEKDVGGFHPLNISRLASKTEEPLFAPCTPGGCVELLHRYNIPIKDKIAVVIGRSRFVGKPAALLLEREGATVTTVHSETKNPEEITRQADIIISAVGKPDLVKGCWVKPGAVLIDVGMCEVEVMDPKGHKRHEFVGDICYREASKVASAITPVPGGVGPMTIAVLLSNTLLSAKRINNIG